MPTFLGTIVTSVSRPGMRSCLPARLGSQKLWITSLERRMMRVGTPTGTCSSLAVRREFDGSDELYWTSHHHCLPVTVIDNFSCAAALAIERSVKKLAIASATSPVEINAPQPISPVRISGLDS